MASINDLATAAIASSSSPKAAGEVAPARGAFIVLEGLDRSGKTTQAKLLEQRFVEEGRPVKLMRFPGESVPDPAPILWSGRRGREAVPGGGGPKGLTMRRGRQDDAHWADD